MNSKRLSEVSTLITKGTTPTTVGGQFKSKGINFVKSESVGQFKHLDQSLFQFIDEETDKMLKRSRLEKDDLLFSIAGAYLGKLSIVRNEDLPANTNQAVGIVRLSAEKVDVNYLYYYFSQRNINLYINNLSSQSSQPNLNLDLLGRLTFDNKDLTTQKRIAKVLSDLDAKIELNNRINRELEAMAKTLYDYWFVQFDFPNELGKPYKSSGGKMVYNAKLKREIPVGWEVGNIGNYCPSSGGFAFKSSWWTNEGVSVVKIKDIQEDYTIDISNLAKVDLTDKKIDDKFKAKPGDILIAMTGATVGKYGIVPITDYPIYVNQRVGYFNLGKEPTEKLPYLINSLNQPYFREMIFSLASGAAQPNISNEQINRISLIIPDRTIVNKYNLKFAPFYKTILNNQRQNQQLTELRDWLLPMLMNGQVTVKEAEEILSIAAEPSVEYKKG